MSSTRVRELASIAPEIFTKMKSVLFGAELDARSALPLLDGYEAGIMLEVVKDLLYEAYVRKGKLQQAIMVRRFFLDETGTQRHAVHLRQLKVLQPTKRRALRNRRIQPLYSPTSRGRQEFCT